MASKINQADFIDINSILNGYRKSWYWFVISIVFFGLLGYVFVKTHNTEYSVHANLLIDDDEANPLLSSADFSVRRLKSTTKCLWCRRIRFCAM